MNLEQSLGRIAADREVANTGSSAKSTRHFEPLNLTTQLEGSSGLVPLKTSRLLVMKHGPASGATGPWAVGQASNDLLA